MNMTHYTNVPSAQLPNAAPLPATIFHDWGVGQVGVVSMAESNNSPSERFKTMLSEVTLEEEETVVEKVCRVD